MGKILIDVTQSSRSSNNSGIQVVTRNLYREIESFHETIPIIWDNRIGKYAHLNKKEHKNLISPFSKNYQPKARPNKQENPFYKDLFTSLLRLNKTINFCHYNSSKNLVLFPEVFRDRRVNQINKLINPSFNKVGIFHDANVLRNPDFTPSARTKNFRNYLSVLSSFTAISCVSNESKNALEKFSFKGKKQDHISVRYLPAEKPRREFQPINLKIPLILCVSTLAYNKNHLTLLRSAEKLWSSGLSFELELIGQYDPSWSQRVLDYMKVLQAKRRTVRWLRHIDQETLEQKYSNCSFTVYPSLYEGFGLPILESLSRSKPCICGSNGAIGEVSKGGGCLNLSNQESTDEMSDAIKSLLLNSRKLEQLKLEAVSRNYGTWEEYAKNVMEFFFLKI